MKWMIAAWITILAVGGMVLATLVTGGEAGGGASPEGSQARAILQDSGGNPVGDVKLKQEGDTVKIKVRIEDGVSPGFHGFHIHTAGTCVAPFTSAGGHYNPAVASHPNHSGDLPALYVDADGEAEARFATDRFALDDLFDADGSAFILHAGRDNYANIPTDRYDPDPDTTTLATGDAGSRFACGVIEGD
jgi:Cu-Zn family superoxide dismutase